MFTRDDCYTLLVLLLIMTMNDGDISISIRTKNCSDGQKLTEKLLSNSLAIF